MESVENVCTRGCRSNGSELIQSNHHKPLDLIKLFGFSWRIKIIEFQLSTLIKQTFCDSASISLQSSSSSRLHSRPIRFFLLPGYFFARSLLSPFCCCVMTWNIYRIISFISFINMLFLFLFIYLIFYFDSKWKIDFFSSLASCGWNLFFYCFVVHHERILNRRRIRCKKRTQRSTRALILSSPQSSLILCSLAQINGMLSGSFDR